MVKVALGFESRRIPKIRAAIRFLEQGGEMVAITSLENARKAVLGEAGTRIVPD